MFGHCWQWTSSSYAPYPGYVAAPGAKETNIRALTRYNNPELTALLNKMEASRPSPQDPEYMKLVKEATRIVLTELPWEGFNQVLMRLKKR